MTRAALVTTGDGWDRFAPPLAAALAGAAPDVRLVPADEGADAEWVVIQDLPEGFDLAAFPRARAVLALWAGIEAILPHVPADLPLVRLVDPAGLTAGMTEWVTGHVLRHHLGIDRYLGAAPHWDRHVPPLARERRVGVLGLGALGADAARALAGFGFDVAGWSRSPKDIPGVAAHTGPDGLRAVIERSEILVLLVPHTPQTEGLMDAERLGWMPEGAVLLNPGRGALVDEAALTAALDSGRPSHATLDTFRTEPLPRDHPFWSDPRVTITPHVASATRPDSAAEAVAANIARALRGAPMEGTVERGRGY